MSVKSQSKTVAILSALICSTSLLWAVSASAMDNDKMSESQSTTGMQDNKAAEGHPQGMKHDDSMSHDKMKSEKMSEDDAMSGDAMKGDNGMSHDKDMKDKEDSM